MFIYDAYHADEMFNKTKFECLEGPNVITNELHKLMNAPKLFENPLNNLSVEVYAENKGMHNSMNKL